VVGARSALFLPYGDLGLVVVDEEHDPAYKQEDGAHYHARDMAVVRGSIAKFPVILASATPSVESEVNARRGRYRRGPVAGRFRRRASAFDRGKRHAVGGSAAGALHFTAACRGRCGLADSRASGLVIPQPPRLRTADVVPCLRFPSAMSELRCLACRPPFQ